MAAFKPLFLLDYLELRIPTDARRIRIDPFANRLRQPILRFNNILIILCPDSGEFAVFTVIHYLFFAGIIKLNFGSRYIFIFVLFGCLGLNSFKALLKLIQSSLGFFRYFPIPSPRIPGLRETIIRKYLIKNNFCLINLILFQ